MTNNSNNNFGTVLQQLQRSYWEATPQRIKLIDAYLVYTVTQGVIQFVYCTLVSSYPYNAFLAGFGGAVASFIFAVVLRMRVNPENKAEYGHQSVERAFAEFVVCNLALHFLVTNYIG
ncbi:oligosaccharyltransferase complex subunit epsilon [Dispira simplex]|nr:oligosaccharyltransferase complex subunit epsilon [Dispira simplex]